MYNGKFILRFEDTDPRLKKAQLGFYDKIREDLAWLDCSPDEEYVQSDRLPLYYEVGTTLITKGAAYVCECTPEAFREKTTANRPCPDRHIEVEEQIRRWTKMLDGGYEEGKAVVRIKTDLTDPNPAVRDWPAFRIIDTVKHPHPRVGSKYRVWPLYNIASGVDDHLLGITHILRGKEHLTNMARQTFMFNHLGWSYPEAVHYGRLKIEGLNLSKSGMMKSVEQNEVSGVDDPRLGTLAALRRRGYSPRAIRELIWSIGPKPVDVTISWDNLNALNRKIIDPIAHRYYFVPNPVSIRISGIDEPYEVHPPLHPDHPEFGNRTLRIRVQNHETHLLLSGADSRLLKLQQELRLMNLFNIKPVASETTEYRRQISNGQTNPRRNPIIQWVPYEDNIPVTVIMPDATQLTGVAETDLSNEPVDSIVQLVRFGFCRVDRSSPEQITLFFGHS
jgi:glutamyl-tRNA synthetase